MNQDNSKRDMTTSMTTYAGNVSASVGHCHDPNLQHRPSMEDEMTVHECEDFPGLFVGVYDGHGGRSASQYLRQLFHRIFLDELLDEELSIAPQNTASIGKPHVKQQQVSSSGTTTLANVAPTRIRTLEDDDLLSACSTPPLDASSEQEDTQDNVDMKDKGLDVVPASLSPSSSMSKDDSCNISTSTLDSTNPLVLQKNNADNIIPSISIDHPRNENELDVINAFKLAYKKMDAVLKFRNCARLGATAVTGFIRKLRNGKRKLTIANCGDSRAVLCRSGRPIDLTTSHRPGVPYERKRIEDSGGFIACGRINGVLNVSRAFGDHWMKSLIICDPDVMELQLSNADEFLVLACDGLWDFVEDDVVMAVAQNAFDRGCASHQVAKLLVKEAVKRNSTDNISVMVVHFDMDE